MVFDSKLRFKKRLYYPTEGTANVNDAMQFLCIGRARIYELIKAATLPSFLDGGKRLFDWGELWQYHIARKVGDEVAKRIPLVDLKLQDLIGDCHCTRRKNPGKCTACDSKRQKLTDLGEVLKTFVRYILTDKRRTKNPESLVP